MNLILEPWHWFILGVFLLLLELLLPSFAALWFGLSALLVGVTLSFMPDLAFTHQLFMWTGFSLGCTYGWFKWIKPLAKNRTNAGQARENTIGQIGIVIQTQLANDHVRVRFTLPILGSDEWLCRSIHPVQVGDRVQVIDILGNDLLIQPYHSSSYTAS